MIGRFMAVLGTAFLGRYHLLCTHRGAVGSHTLFPHTLKTPYAFPISILLKKCVQWEVRFDLKSIYIT